MDTDDRHPPQMADTFAAVHSLVLNTSTIDDFLGELAVLAAEIVDPAASCGITAYRDGEATTVASSDKRGHRGRRRAVRDRRGALSHDARHR